MNLKESFRYSNWLQVLLVAIQDKMESQDDWYTTTQTHEKKAVNPEAEDKVVTDNEIRNGAPHFDLNKVMQLAEKAMKEYENLQRAIAKAKAEAEVQIDAEIAINRQKQMLARRMGGMSRAKNKTRVFKDTDYRFNSEGNQVPYLYRVTEAKNVSFDTEKAREMMKRLMLETNETSTKIEKQTLDLAFSFEPAFDITDSTLDVINTCLAETA